MGITMSEQTDQPCWRCGPGTAVGYFGDGPTDSDPDEGIDSDPDEGYEFGCSDCGAFWPGRAGWNTRAETPERKALRQLITDESYQFCNQGAHTFIALEDIVACAQANGVDMSTLGKGNDE